MKPLVIDTEQAGQRLDAALSVLAPQLSRSSWQSLIISSRVKLNGRIETRPARTVNEGDKIFFSLPSLPKKRPNLPTLYEDEDTVVFDKPSGMLTHAKGELAKEWTLADIARPFVEDDGTNRPGIVHRLDRGTSGIIVVAKNQRTKRFLQRQFAARSVEKTYQAIVHGNVAKSDFSIDMPIARDPKNPKKFTVRSDGKPAQTTVKMLKAGKSASLLELRPKTGRTHQLRVHLKAAGHPIIGDDLYGTEIDRAEVRLYLHASRLKLTLTSGQTVEFESQLPPDFTQGAKHYGLA